MNEKNDLLLIADGDEKAFFEFYSKQSDLLRPFLLTYTRSETDVEDIIQETFIKVWLNRNRLPDIENIRGWICRIASRVYLDHLERELKLRERKASFGEALYGPGLVVSGERTRLTEITNSIRKALDELPEQKKKVFCLNRELGMKPAEIAALLKIPVGTVKNQLSAALRQVREQLAASGYGPVTVLYLLWSLCL